MVRNSEQSCLFSRAYPLLMIAPSLDFPAKEAIMTEYLGRLRGPENDSFRPVLFTATPERTLSIPKSRWRCSTSRNGSTIQQ